MVVESASPFHLGVSFGEITVTAINNSGTAIAAGDVVVFDVSGTGTVTPTSGSPYNSLYSLDYVTDVGTGATNVATNGPSAIALEAVAAGARGSFMVRGRCEAAVQYSDAASTGAIAAGAGVSLPQFGTADKTALYGVGEVTATTQRTVVCAITLEEIADDAVREVVWVQFDGIRGFGAF